MDRIFELTAVDLPVFLLAFFRVTGVMMLAPVFGSQMPPVPVKIFLSLVLAMIFFPLIERAGPAMPSDFPTLAVAAGGELAVGLLIGFAAALIFAGIQFGGYLVDQELGLLQANVLDPLSNEQISLMGQFKVFLATVIYLLIGGHHLLITAVADSFRVVPLLGVRFTGETALFLTDGLVRDVFRMGVEIAAPVLVTLFLITIALAFMARTVPEMNIFVLGFSLRVVVGMLVLTVGVGLFVEGTAGRLTAHSGAVRKLVTLLGGS